MKTGFGHFHDFCTSKGLDIAYHDSAKCFLTFGYDIAHAGSFKNLKKCIFEWSEEPKRRFLAIFSSLVCRIDLILHIVVVLNILQHVPTRLGHEGSFKNHRNAFFNNSKSKKRGFWPFSWVWSVGSTWYGILW